MTERRFKHGVYALVLLMAAGCQEQKHVAREAAPAAQGGEVADGGRAPAAMPAAGPTSAPSSAGGSSATQAGMGTAGSAGAGGKTSPSSGGAGSTRSAAAGASGVPPTPSSAAAGSGGSGTPASSVGVPSAGCSKHTARPASGVVMQSDRIYAFPASYDGLTPLPLLLGLHAAGNPNTQIQNLTKGSRLETDYVRVFPKSAGSAWVYDTDSNKLKAILDDVLANYCIDESRQFATGHSSGAQMLVQMLCNGDTRWKGVAPVAASKYCNKLAAVPVLYVQGMMDAQRGGGNGMDVVTLFSTSNGCMSSSMPWTDVMGCSSSFDHQPVTPGCVTFQACKAATVWCSHNDNGYNNTDGRQHGWPCFASGAIADFFGSLR